ncbi:MAG: hypothetical protein R3Y49_04385 [Rikenellaceae bacterium]
MIFFLIILYALTLLYAAMAERFRHYGVIVGAQGWLLLGIALCQLHDSGLFERVFIITETVIFKGLVIPFLLFRLIRRAQINRISYRAMPPFFSILLSITALGVSLWAASYVAEDSVGALFFGVALYGMLMGMILIMSRVRIFSHLVGFLIIENSVMLFSLAVGTHMPMLINIGILLDILMGVLMLSIFMGKISSSLHSLDSNELSHLKD